MGLLGFLFAGIAGLFLTGHVLDRLFLGRCFLFSVCSSESWHYFPLLLPLDLGTQLGTLRPDLFFIPIAWYPFQHGPFFLAVLLDFFFFAGIFISPIHCPRQSLTLCHLRGGVHKFNLF
jgi:hypothetical protein